MLIQIINLKVNDIKYTVIQFNNNNYLDKEIFKNIYINNCEKNYKYNSFRTEMADSNIVW